MIVDSSALIAILKGEPEDAEFSQILQNNRVLVSAATVVEASLVAGPNFQEALDAVLAMARAEIVPFDAVQSRIARRAHLTYGRGSGSPAKLNLGDCLAYALAKQTGMPLLFKGDDFTHTDVTPARGQDR